MCVCVYVREFVSFYIYINVLFELEFLTVRLVFDISLQLEGGVCNLWS